MNDVIRRAFESQVDPKYASKVEADFFEMGFLDAIEKVINICNQVRSTNYVYVDGANLVEKEVRILME